MAPLATLPGLYVPSEESFAPLLECPSFYVPTDVAPSKDEQGSFKGYSNRWTYHNVGGEYDLDTKEKLVTFANESESLNMFTSSATMGCIIGFAVFGLGVLYAVVMIAVDMKRRLAMYEELIQEDLAKMDAMGLSGRMPEFEKELNARLQGEKGAEGVDDQLVTQALELRNEEFAAYM